MYSVLLGESRLRSVSVLVSQEQVVTGSWCVFHLVAVLVTSVSVEGAVFVVENSLCCKKDDFSVITRFIVRKINIKYLYAVLSATDVCLLVFNLPVSVDRISVHFCGRCCNGREFSPRCINVKVRSDILIQKNALL